MTDELPRIDATQCLSESEEREAAYRHIYHGWTYKRTGEWLGVSGSTIGKVVNEYKSFTGDDAKDLEHWILDEFEDTDEFDDKETDDETTTFNFESDGSDTEQPDVYVDETFVDAYNTERAYLDGDTYNAKDIIKFDWETTHHKFDESSKRWMVDVDALEELGQKLEEAGYTFSDGLETDDESYPLHELQDAAESDDRITVEYWQKNGNGVGTKEGDIADATLGEHGDAPKITFYRDDGQYMYVRMDKFGKPALYTGKSTNPFVGALKSVTIDRVIDETEDTDDDDGDADDDADELTETAETFIEKREERRESKLLDSVLEDMGEE